MTQKQNTADTNIRVTVQHLVFKFYDENAFFGLYLCFCMIAPK